MLEIKIRNESHHPLPEYQTSESAGMDLRAFLNAPFMLKKGSRALIPTGLFMELSKGYEAQIRPRSGLAYKHGVSVLNSPGTIDSDYRGEIKVLLINHGEADFEINDGERIAQMIISQHEQISWKTSENLNESSRSAGGFGSTGNK